tara:strand:+ start:309 stop:1004 length:696 start_codon:yes stop_codon:yes gene_type:complete
MDYTIMKIPKIISIEGNIGAGKTTFTNKLKEKLKYEKRILFITEPINIWESIKDSKGKNILEKFYENPGSYAFPFQIMAYVTRLNNITKAIADNPQCEIIVTERSLDADMNVFAKMLYDDKLIEDINYQIYLQFYNNYKNKFNTSAIIHIDANPNVCNNRINNRNRLGESNLDLNYLIKCDEYHKRWLSKEKRSTILVIDANKNATYDENNKNDIGLIWLDDAISFINKFN